MTLLRMWRLRMPWPLQRLSLLSKQRCSPILSLQEQKMR